MGIRVSEKIPCSAEGCKRILEIEITGAGVISGKTPFLLSAAFKESGWTYLQKENKYFCPDHKDRMNP